MYVTHCGCTTAGLGWCQEPSSNASAAPALLIRIGAVPARPCEGGQLTHLPPSQRLKFMAFTQSVAFTLSLS